MAAYFGRIAVQIQEMKQGCTTPETLARVRRLEAELERHPLYSEARHGARVDAALDRIEARVRELSEAP